MNINTLTRVQSYQTSDKELFTDKIEALNHEFGLTLQKFIIDNNPMSQRNFENLTPKSIAQLIVKEQDKITDLLHDYRNKLASAKRTGKKENNCSNNNINNNTIELPEHEIFQAVS